MPPWICGEYVDTVAVRITDHPIAALLCEQFGKPIVSTSANLSKGSPAKDTATVQQRFPQGIDIIIKGEVGSLAQPTQIFEALTGLVLR